MDRCGHICIRSVPRNYGHHHHERGHTHSRRGIRCFGGLYGMGRHWLSPRTRSVDSCFWLDWRQNWHKEDFSFCTISLHSCVGSMRAIAKSWSTHLLPTSSRCWWRHARSRRHSDALPVVSSRRARSRIHHFNCSHRCCTGTWAHHRWCNSRQLVMAMDFLCQLAHRSDRFYFWSTIS